MSTNSVRGNDVGGRIAGQLHEVPPYPDVASIGVVHREVPHRRHGPVGMPDLFSELMALASAEAVRDLTAEAPA